MSYVKNLGISAKKASAELAKLTTLKKNDILNAIVRGLKENKEFIIAENKKDLDNGIKKGLSKAFIDRLTLTEERINGMISSVNQIADFADPIGEIVKGWRHGNGMNISQIRVPLGVLAMIFESRPNVTIDAAALAIKSGNAIILRGGSDAINSNMALAKIIYDYATPAGLPLGAVQLIDKPEREIVNELLKLNEYVDVAIPRGGKGLKKAIIANATIPVIETGAGICHTYVDRFADLKKALNIVENAKVQRPGVCNSLETLLINKEVATAFLPLIIEKLRQSKVEIKGCEKSLTIDNSLIKATEEDWDTEYLDLIISIKIVDNIDEAIAHINRFSSMHSEAIITEDINSGEKFLNEVDAAAVYLNASTRFTDGGEFGFGGEIGISTQKLHARGPMGIRELTTLKYIIRGNGQIR